MGHKHAQRIIEYGNDALEHDEPWLLWSSQHEDDDENGDWLDCDQHPKWFVYRDYRRKPKTITINGFDCLDDFVIETPMMGEKFYYEAPAGFSWYSFADWFNSDFQEVIFSRRIIHLTKEGAIQACKARLGIKDD